MLFFSEAKKSPFFISLLFLQPFKIYRPYKFAVRALPIMEYNKKVQLNKKKSQRHFFEPSFAKIIKFRAFIMAFSTDIFIPKKTLKIFFIMFFSNILTAGY